MRARSSFSLPSELIVAIAVSKSRGLISRFHTPSVESGSSRCHQICVMCSSALVASSSVIGG